MAEEAEEKPSSTEAAPEAVPEVPRRKIPPIETRRLEKMLTVDEVEEILSGVVIKQVGATEKKDQSQTASEAKDSAN